MYNLKMSQSVSIVSNIIHYVYTVVLGHTLQLHSGFVEGVGRWQTCTAAMSKTVYLLYMFILHV